ncbi:translation initiation factor 2D [Acrasis kona]|uniref:Translation initiation factor 2D n=1 Tax=Acrasis kona TaxID=1008807 RepID=A0AAW2YVW2_9EUKA
MIQLLLPQTTKTIPHKPNQTQKSQSFTYSLCQSYWNHSFRVTTLKTVTLPEKQIKTILTDYLKKECSLADKNNGQVKLNTFLYEQLFRTKKQEENMLQDGDTTTIARIQSKLISKLKNHFAIKYGNQEESSLVVQKGECKGIMIETESVMGNKSITKVNGLGPFLAPVDESTKNKSLDCVEFWDFVKAVKLKASSSVKANVEADPHKNESELVIQGSVAQGVSDLLVEDYGIPKNLIIVNDKLKKKKKKK